MASTEQSSILPPAPEQLPPLREDYAKGDQGKLFHHAWTRWFLTIREKVNVISTSLVNLGSTGGTGFMVKDSDNWTPRTIEDTAYTDVTNGDGVSGNPVIDLSASSKASLANADSALQPGDNVSTLINDAGYQTAAQVSSALAVLIAALPTTNPGPGSVWNDGGVLRNGT